MLFITKLCCLSFVNIFEHMMCQYRKDLQKDRYSLNIVRDIKISSKRQNQFTFLGSLKEMFRLLFTSALYG